DADIILNGEHKFGIFDEDPEHETQNVYDLQNVLTHELGHLLGLGEDYEDEYATMYAFSQPGETIKRDLEPVDVDSVVSLYIEPIDNSSAGCGGATIAAQNSEAWLWTALGLLGVGAVMRRRSVRAAAAGVSVLGALVIGMSTSSSLPSKGVLFAGDTVHEGLALNALPSVVTGAEARWEDGLIVTKLTLRTQPATGAAQELSVETLGGQVGDLVQQVGHVRPPIVGDALTLRFDDPSAMGGHRVLTLADFPRSAR
ncbi:MAG: matrixin family metalloprotease, partial [Polyangiaceae bacterium]